MARIFNTYGPRMHPMDGRVVSNFIVQALRDEPITIYGDGSQTRSFCYVTDLIDGFVRFMATPKDVIGPINLGNRWNTRFSNWRRRSSGSPGRGRSCGACRCLRTIPGSAART